MTTSPPPANEPGDAAPAPDRTGAEATRPGAVTPRASESVPPPGEPFHGPHPETSWERADRRWDLRAQGRDFVTIAVMIVVYLVWVGIVYFFEPGIR